MTNFDWLSILNPLFAAQESWLDGSYNKPATAHLMSRTDTPFTIACGAGLLSEHVRRFKFSPPVIQRLGQVTDAKGRSVFQESFLNHLQRLQLRTHVQAAPEGTLLFPEEVLLTIQAPELQIRLLETAIQLLIWESSYWATQAAVEQWNWGVYAEEDTPHAPNFPFNPQGWKMRALYIGGAPLLENKHADAPAPAWPGLALKQHPNGAALSQIRRLFKGEHPLGDVWLSASQEAQASVSHTHIQFYDLHSEQKIAIQMSRFQNLMQPVLVKGHPALNSPSLDYLRQRSWKQMEAFHALKLAEYPRGWFVE